MGWKKRGGRREDSEEETGSSQTPRGRTGEVARENRATQADEAMGPGRRGYSERELGTRTRAEEGLRAERCEKASHEQRSRFAMGYLLAKVISRDDKRGKESDGTRVSQGVFAGIAQFKTVFDSMLRYGGFSSN